MSELMLSEGGFLAMQEQGTLLLQSGTGSTAGLLVVSLAWLGMFTFMYLVLNKSNTFIKNKKRGSDTNEET